MISGYKAVGGDGKYDKLYNEPYDLMKKVWYNYTEDPKVMGTLRTMGIEYCIRHDYESLCSHTRFGEDMKSFPEIWEIIRHVGIINNTVKEIKTKRILISDIGHRMRWFNTYN